MSSGQRQAGLDELVFHHQQRGNGDLGIFNTSRLKDQDIVVTQQRLHNVQHSGQRRVAVTAALDFSIGILADMASSTLDVEQGTDQLAKLRGQAVGGVDERNGISGHGIHGILLDEN